MHTVRLLADDLTGALDAAAQFTGRLGPVPVFLNLPCPVPPGHCALDAACRDVPAAEAVTTMRRLGDFFEAGCAFKKIDSLLRGNWAAELAAVLDDGRFRSAVVAPAFPEQGRVTRGGRQWVREVDGGWQPLAIHAVSALREAGLNARPIQRPRNGVPVAPGTIMVVDAEDAEDLAGIVAWGTTLPQPTLWVGSAGLARALAGTAPRRNGSVTKPVLALIGSAHPAMREQIERAGHRDSGALCPVTEDVARSVEGIAEAFDADRPCVAYFPLSEEIGPRAAADRIARRIAAVLPLIPSFPTAVIAGGETLRALCVAAGANWLVAEAEFSPGVPRSRIVGGRWDGQAVISKSGAFGAPDFLADML